MRSLYQGFLKSGRYNLILKTFFALIFFTVTMLNIDTIRAQKTVISELFRNIFRYVPVLLGAILIYILENATIVDVYLIGFLILCLISTACTIFLIRKIFLISSRVFSLLIKKFF